jgi:branched-chain amino acid transport system ATP-binding protein
MATEITRPLAQPLLKIEGLVKRFGGLLVTDDVSLDIHQGEIHAVIGPNGAGKTTLVNQIVGELRSDAGRIHLMGQDITRSPVAYRARAGLGRSYQINSVISSFTVLENMLLSVQSGPAGGKHNFHFWQPATQSSKLVARAEEIMLLLGLEGQRDRLAGALSYGQQRLIEIAMALASSPKVLLLDEPMAGLGPAETQQMIALLQRLQKDYAILLIEHDMHAVFTLATRLSVLVYGKVVMCDTPQAVRASPIVREAYLGDEEIAA